MSKTKAKAKTSKVNFGKHLRVLILMSLFSALSILFGKYLAINLGSDVRISFENLPILLAGVLLGPIHGMIVGVVADLVGCIGLYSPNPILTVGAGLIGLSSGLLFRVSKPLPTALRVFIATFTAHIVGSMLVKTVGLIAWYGSDPLLFLIRTYYFITAAIEGALILTIVKSPVNHALNKMLGRTTPPKRKQRK